MKPNSVWIVEYRKHHKQRWVPQDLFATKREAQISMRDWGAAKEALNMNIEYRVVRYEAAE